MIITFIGIVKLIFQFVFIENYCAFSSNENIPKDIESHSTVKISKGNRCIFFASNRYSEPENSLINCTWYRNEACCKRTEVTSVFDGMFPLYDATHKCQNMMNYLMCYFCSPFQSQWYRNNKTVVCSSFCQSLFQSCRTAKYKGRMLGNEYDSGESFCLAQNFQVLNSDMHCFAFDPAVFGSNISIKIEMILIIFSLIFVVLFGNSH